MVLFATVLFQAIDTVPMATDSSRACSLEGYLCLLSQRKKRGSRVDERGRFCGGKKERRWEMMESFGGVKAGARLKRRNGDNAT